MPGSRASVRGWEREVNFSEGPISGIFGSNFLFPFFSAAGISLELRLHPVEFCVMRGVHVSIGFSRKFLQF